MSNQWSSTSHGGIVQEVSTENNIGRSGIRRQNRRSSISSNASTSLHNHISPTNVTDRLRSRLPIHTVRPACFILGLAIGLLLSTRFWCRRIGEDT